MPPGSIWAVTVTTFKMDVFNYLHEKSTNEALAETFPIIANYSMKALVHRSKSDWELL